MRGQRADLSLVNVLHLQRDKMPTFYYLAAALQPKAVLIVDLSLCCSYLMIINEIKSDNTERMW